jgi:hypothetical protein
MSEVMSLRLQGEDFTIEPQMAEKQAVGDAPVFWLWVVTPRRS